LVNLLAYEVRFSGNIVTMISSNVDLATNLIIIIDLDITVTIISVNITIISSNLMIVIGFNITTIFGTTFEITVETG